MKSFYIFQFMVYGLYLLSIPMNGQDLRVYKFGRSAMGTQLNITLYTTDPKAANRASEAAFERVEELNTIFSDYDTDSELNQLCKASNSNKWIRVSDELFDILYQSKHISKLTKGAFDVTIGPYTKMWRLSKKDNRLPSKQQLAQAKSAVGYLNMSFDKREKVLLERAEMQLDLGAIAKGYTADEVLKVLKQYNIEHALIDFGGDITVGRPPPNKEGWNIQVSHANREGERISEILSVGNMSVATSGGYYQQLTVSGNTYSHIIDPSTGLGITRSIQVTVIAPSGALADSFASAFSVMDKNDIKTLLKKNKNIHVFIASLDGASLETWCSESYNSFILENQ